MLTNAPRIYTFKGTIAGPFRVPLYVSFLQRYMGDGQPSVGEVINFDVIPEVVVRKGEEGHQQEQQVEHIYTKDSTCSFAIEPGAFSAATLAMIVHKTEDVMERWNVPCFVGTSPMVPMTPMPPDSI